MNIHLASRYDERVVHLALGIEPLDATSGLRLADGVDVRVERCPRPLDRWRPWRPGETLTGALPRMPRHRSGRFALLYGSAVIASSTIDVRAVDDGVLGASRVPGTGRRIVPRRVRVAIAGEADVLVAEADPTTPPHPAWRRIVPLPCFPGSAAPLPSRSTVLRGRVVRQDAGGELVPVRWTRIRADAGGVAVGWAHGDDRGEFVLVLGTSPADVVVPADPTAVTLTVGAVLPPPAPDPADPIAARVDPLWDLPIEELTLDPDPSSQPSITGRGFLPDQSVLTPLNPNPIELPHGRETSVSIRIA